MTNPQNPDESPEPLTGSAPQSGQESDPTPSLSKPDPAESKPNPAEETMILPAGTEWAAPASSEQWSPESTSGESSTPGQPRYTGSGSAYPGGESYPQTPGSAPQAGGYPPYPEQSWQQGQQAYSQNQPYQGQPYEGQPYQQGQAYQQGQPQQGQPYQQSQPYQQGQPYPPGSQTGGYPQYPGQPQQPGQPYPYQSGQYPQGAYGAPQQQSGTQLFSIIGFVCAALALFFCPILFGPAGIILGLVGRNKGESLGKWAAIASAVCLVLGLLFAFFVWGGVIDNDYYNDRDTY
ncbi:phage holin family protein [Nocardia sp. XZ_19_385]|uniref:phage holin family protein n=1 Tax=Nocardia sp. XZ_19_385 TaxID=2769488 RepID=UPI00188E5123|nr:phage holin family protein [Nocardia sp. XZ_19_385]